MSNSLSRFFGRVGRVWDKPSVHMPVSSIGGLLGAVALYAHLEPSKEPSQPILPLSEQTEEFKWATAVHEAGHAVAILALNQQHVQLDQVTIRPSKEAWGLTNLDKRLSRMSGSSSDSYAAIAILYAGYQAEKIINGQTSLGVGNDITMATELAADMEEAGMGDNIPADIGILGERWLLHPDTQAAYQSGAFNNLRYGYDVSAGIIMVHAKQVEDLAKALVADADGTLSPEEIKEIVGFDEKQGLPVMDENGSAIFPKNRFDYYYNLVVQPSPEEEPDTVPSDGEGTSADPSPQ